MAFISEINFYGGDGVAGGEYVEIALGPDDDPADFVVSVYSDDGTLDTSAGISGGEVTLSSLVGVPDPDNSDYTIYVIDVGLRNAVSDSNEGSAIALTDTSTSTVIDFYSADTLGAITATQGAADTATSEPIFDHKALNTGESYQWDIYGNLTLTGTTENDAVLCLTQDCDVKTMSGIKRAGDLVVGDLVWTLDHGFQPLRWIGQTDHTQADLSRFPNNRPIRVAKNALAPNVPTADILLSAQHRILLRSKAAMRMYGVEDVLVAAKKLIDFDGISIEQDAPGVQYLHLLFDHHEILDVNGALTESLYMGACSLDLLEGGVFVDDCQNRHHVTDLGLARTAARPFVEGKRGKTFLQRMARNNKPLQPMTTERTRADRLGES